MFIDYDFFTGFGTPFELLLEGTYLIRSKGGIVGGYSGFMSFIPELELSTSNLVYGCIALRIYSSKCTFALEVRNRYQTSELLKCYMYTVCMV